MNCAMSGAAITDIAAMNQKPLTRATRRSAKRRLILTDTSQERGAIGKKNTNGVYSYINIPAAIPPKPAQKYRLRAEVSAITISGIISANKMPGPKGSSASPPTITAQRRLANMNTVRSVAPHSTFNRRKRMATRSTEAAPASSYPNRRSSNSFPE